jgi:hypothetical protein
VDGWSHILKLVICVTIDILNADSVYLHSKNIRACAWRRSLLIPLLLGLLFSGGEGITLLPFPDMSARSSDSLVLLSSSSGNERIDLDTNKGSIQAKLPVRDMVQHAGAYGVAFLFSGDASASEVGSEPSYERPVTLTTAFPTCISGRAPPFSES